LIPEIESLFIQTFCSQDIPLFVSVIERRARKKEDFKDTGNNFLFSGEWWITFFPAIFLIVLALSINLLGDWMRDALNPKLKKR